MGFILVRTCALVQCSVDHNIAWERVTTSVLVCKEGCLPFLYLKGRTLQWDLYSTGEIERDLLPELSWWVLRRVVHSCAPGMASSFPAALALIASPSLTST